MDVIIALYMRTAVLSAFIYFHTFPFYIGVLVLFLKNSISAPSQVLCESHRAIYYLYISGSLANFLTYVSF